MQGRTRHNVETALADEAMAVLRYQLFADQARDEGYGRIAELFLAAAGRERPEHFRQLAALVGLVGTTRENLKAAMGGQVTEHRNLYPRFAAQAGEDGESEAERRFGLLHTDERCHADRLRDELDELEVSDLELASD